MWQSPPLCQQMFLKELLSSTNDMVTMDYDPKSSGKESYILCADCGTVISSANGAGLCTSTYQSFHLCQPYLTSCDCSGVGCLRNSVDITDGIPKEATLMFCRGCERFLSPPQTWQHAQPESRELLGKSIHFSSQVSCRSLS